MRKNIKKRSFTANHILRFLSLACLAFTFLPHFLLTGLYDEEVVGLISLIRGISYGARITAPHPIAAICAVLPVIMLTAVSVKKRPSVIGSSIVAACSVIDLIVWVIIGVALKGAAEAKYASAITMDWHVINLITLALTFVVAFLSVCYMRRTYSDENATLVDEAGTDEINSLTVQDVPVIEEIVPGPARDTTTQRSLSYCPKCGRPIESGWTFCTSCGTPVSSGMASRE